MTKKHAGGRPKIEIDFKTLDNLLGIFCTGEECAAVLGVNYDTLNARVKEEKSMSFSEYSEIKRGLGRASLRRRQFQMAEKNPALAIWLGKQYLGQVDRQEVDTTHRFTEIPLITINGKEMEKI